MRINCCPFVLVMSLVLIAAPVSGQEFGATAAESTDVRHLELGDGYEVVVRRDGVEQRYSGKLVQVTDEWIVLRTLSEGRNEYGVPVMSKVPYANRLFRNVGIGRSTNDRWIPRDAATIVGRSMREERGDFPPLAAQEPTWKEVVRIDLAQGEKVDDFAGTLTREGETLHHIHLVVEEVETPWPVLGRLPVLGGTFTTREVVLREEARDVPLGSVLSVVEPAPEDRVERVGVDFE